MRRLLLSLVLLLFSFIGANALIIGYSKGIPDQTKIFNMGTAYKQGQAIRLSKAKLQFLKGKSIDYVEFSVGTKNTVGNTVHAFICTKLNDVNLAEEDIHLSKAFIKNKWILDKPYIITGDESELYIGYVAETPSEHTKLLVADGNDDIKGYNFALQNDTWVDTYGTNRGSAYITFNVDGVPDYVDAIIGYNDFSGYYRAVVDNDFSLSFVNAGTITINKFDAVLSIDGQKQIQHFNDVNILPKSGYQFHLQGVGSDIAAAQTLNVKIENINGGDNDIDTSDNDISASLFFYPKNMQRGILVEGFTGQDCSGCPGGHENIQKAIQQSEQSISDKIVEVSHHAGYYADIFTMAEDNDYKFYYQDPNHTAAPAVMVNRLADKKTNPTAPVMDTSNYGSIMQQISNAAVTKPYVSLNLETKLDESSRELNVKFQITPEEPLPCNTIFNVFFVQDSIKAYQNNGGENYNHRKVFRGTLTGDSFGIPIENLSLGDVYTWEKTVNIPQKIHSSFYTDDMLQEITDDDGTKKQVYLYTSPITSNTFKMDAEQTNIDAILKDMSVVAYVAEYDNTDKTHNTVYNCVEVKLGDSYKQDAFDNATNINTLSQYTQNNISINNGKLCVEGDYDNCYVYTILGKQMNVDLPLPQGVYIVKVVSSNSKQMIQKVFVK